MSLRFGILADGNTFQQWEAECLRQVLAVEGVELALIVMDTRPAPKPNPWYRKWKALRNAGSLPWEIYRKRFAETIPARRPVDLSAMLEGVPRLYCTVVRRGKFSEYFTPEDVAKILDYRLDFMIRFRFNIIRGEILSAARFGVWSFHHDDLDRYRGSPPCFWEVYYRDPQTGITLQRLTDRLDSGVVLRKESFPTVLNSYPQNLERGLRFGIPWPADLCRQILNGDTTAVERSPSSSTAPIYKAPSLGQLLRLLLNLGGRSK